MRQKVQQLLVLMAVLVSSSAYAQVVDPMEVMVITPAEGTVTSMQHFTITFGDLPVVVRADSIPTLSKGGGATLSGRMRAGEDGKTVLVDFDENVTAPGQYFLNLPGGSIVVNGRPLLPLSLRYNIEGDIDSFYEQITIDPAEGEVERLQYFTISFPQYVSDIAGRATLTNTSTQKSYHAGLVSVGYNVLAYLQNEITEAGEYTLTIPAGAVKIYTLGEDVHELIFNYTIPGEPGPTFYEQITIDPAEGPYQQLQQFAISFPEGVNGVAEGSLATLTNTTTGTVYQTAMNAADSTVQVNFAEAISEIGRYELTIPAGAIIIDALGEEMQELKFNYAVVDGEMPAFTINPPEGEVYRLQYFTIAYGQKVLVDEEAHPFVINDETGDTYMCNMMEIGGNAVAYMTYPLSVLGDYSLVVPAGCIRIEATWQTNPEMEFKYSIVEKETFVPNVIEHQPAGELRMYHRTGYVVREVEKDYTVEEGEYPYERVFEQQDGSLSIVFADSNKVYIQRPVSWSYYGGWVEGTLDADGRTIIVPMGQYIAYTQSLEMAVQVGVFVYDDDAQTYLYDESIDEMYYTINDDGSISLESTDEYVILGTMNRAFGDQFQYLDYEWLQAGDYGSVYIPADEQPQMPPADLATENYYLTTANYDGTGWDPYSVTVAMGFDGDDVWLQGLSRYLPEGWIKGHSEDGTITFPNSQLLGSYEVLLYFKCAEVDLTNGNTTQKDMVLTFDGVDTYTTQDYVFITTDKDQLYYVNYYQGLTISKHPDTAFEAPEGLRTMEYLHSFTTRYDGGSTVNRLTTVHVGFKDDEVYIQGLWEYMPEAWTLGHMVDGKLVIDMPQYQGRYRDDEDNAFYPIYFVAFNSANGRLLPQVTFDFDEKTGTISNPDVAYGVGINKTGYLNLQDFYNAVLTPVIPWDDAVDEIGADAVGPVEYFDLQGRRITDLDAATGIIITRHANGTVTKTLKR